MATLILFNKPYDVLSQFTDKENRPTLADFIDFPGVYPAGRLDRDSEGLLLLTDDGALQKQISSPEYKMPKTYLVQVEGKISRQALQQLKKGIVLKDGITREAKVQAIEAPQLWERPVPVRDRKSIPTSWIKLVINEGRNRQVRRMTAACGFPTLRLIRSAIGPWDLDGLGPGEYRKLQVNLPRTGNKRVK